MDAFEAIKATFFQECDELLADLEAKLMLLEQGQTDLETINAVFRAVHSVKGGAGAFGLEALVRFAHVFETLMDELRAGRKPCDAITIKTLLRASDVLADHIQAAQGLIPPVDEARSAALVAEMQVLTHGGVLIPQLLEPVQYGRLEGVGFGHGPNLLRFSARWCDILCDQLQPDRTHEQFGLHHHRNPPRIGTHINGQIVFVFPDAALLD